MRNQNLARDLDICDATTDPTKIGHDAGFLPNVSSYHREIWPNPDWGNLYKIKLIGLINATVLF